MDIRAELETNGYCVIPDVLNREECLQAYNMFHEWKGSIPNHDKIHYNVDPHGIYKYLGVGHTRHAWFIRTREKVQNIFKELWGCDELVVSFDGSCYIPKDLKKKDKCWLHSDQAPINEGLQCIQGFVSVTENSERTFVVYEGTHKSHHQYFKDKGIQNSKNWNKISEEDVENMKELRRVLHVPAGSLVIWDSRTFHQNQYGAPNSEERLVQYVCFLPKDHPKNTKNMKAKRLKYYNDRRTTSHWPCPIRVNSLQPQTYGDNSRLIDYSSLTSPNLQEFESEIMKLL